jgi:hypothetical protein
MGGVRKHGSAVVETEYPSREWMRLPDDAQLEDFLDNRGEDFCGVAYLLAYGDRRCPRDNRCPLEVQMMIGKHSVPLGSITRVACYRDHIAMTLPCSSAAVRKGLPCLNNSLHNARFVLS